jgi:hypothetical protein
MGDEGLETCLKTPGKTRGAAPGGAKSGAVRSEIATLADPDPARLVTVWPSLPEFVKGAVRPWLRDEAKALVETQTFPNAAGTVRESEGADA